MANERRKILGLAIILFLVALRGVAAGEAVQTSYLYKLSDFTGPIPYSWVNLHTDPQQKEIYVISGNTVKIFNQNGMEIYSFGNDSDFGVIADVAVEPDGHILVLTYLGGEAFGVVRCDYRGKPVSKIAIKDLPPPYSGILPNRIATREGTLYLADLRSRKFVVTDSKGLFQKGYDISALIQDEEKTADPNELGGFTVDRDGNILFTIPTLFRAFKLSPEGTMASFGGPGSVPGKFNVAAGIASDDQGYIYVADTLRCVVTIFDRDLRFVMEFGTRGWSAGELIAPKELVADNNQRVYVSQAGGRGVSVFKVAHD